MSLILDALNRSRQDADPVPGLATPHYPDSEESGLARWQQWLPWIALLCALLVIGWLLMGKFGSQEEPRQNRSDSSVAVKGESAAAERGSRSPGSPSVVVGPGNPTAAIERPPPPTVTPRVRPKPQPAPPSEPLAGPQRTPATQSGVGVSRVVAAPPAVAPETDEAVARLYQSAAQPATAKPASQAPAQAVAPPRPQPEEELADVEPKVAQEQPIDIAEVLSQAERELGKASLPEHPAPFLASLSQQKKDAIPTLMYQQHDYASGTGSSVVVINGKSARVGGSVASGVRVDEILPGSVVLSHQGTQFRLRALNSWVNL